MHLGRSFAALAAVFLAVALVVPAATPAFGQSIQARGIYRVVGVAPNDRLNVRAAPNTRARIVGRLRYDARGVVATGRTARVGQGLWAEITYGRVRGWVNARFLTGGQAAPTGKPHPGPYRVVGVARNDTLNMRSGAGPRYSLVGRIPATGRGITAVGPSTRIGSTAWWVVRHQGRQGWVSSKYLARDSAPPPPPPVVSTRPHPGPYKVVGVAPNDTLSMRTGPGPKHFLMGRIPPAARGIKATGRHKAVGRTIWWTVTYGGREGWVSSKFLTRDFSKPVVVGDGKSRGPIAPLPDKETPVEAEGPRVALVIGNGAYKDRTRIPALPNPPNDGRDMANALRKLGFKVVEAIDADLKSMEKSLKRFADWADGARIALVFYAGHGMQANGENYLLPVSASLEQAEDITEQSLSLSAVMRALDRASPSLGLVILDACRNNPMTSELALDAASRGLSRVKISKGLARHKGAPGTLIAYSTDPDNVAVDGTGRNSPFTEALLKNMQVPELEIRLMFGNVRESVSKATDGKQTPWVEEAVLGRYYFKPPPKIRTSRFHGKWLAEHYTLHVDENEVRIERPPFVGEPPVVLKEGSKDCRKLFKKDYSIIAPNEIRTRLTDPQIKKWAQKNAKDRSLMMMKIVCGYRTHIYYLLLADFQQLLLAEFSEQDYVMREGFYKPPN